MTCVERACVAAVAVVALVGALAPARAQSAEAEVLFRAGRDLIKRGEIVAGCDKLAASERLESSIGTLLNLGDCREKLGTLASAWAAFRKAEAMARRTAGEDRRQAEAGRRAALLEPRLSNLEIKVPARVPGLIVRRDGEILDGARWNTALPLDPGSYAVVAEAPGHQPWRTTVQVGPGTRRQVVVVPHLERLRITPAGARSPAMGPAAPGPREPAAVATAPRAGTWSATRIWSAGAGLAGAGGLGAGISFGLHARALQGRADRRCPQVVCGDPGGLALNHQAQVWATRANLLYAAGGAALATAIVLWFVGAPGEAMVVPAAGDHRLGVAMAGTF
jgi:hypothetical protein